jgi:hypothetical protein
MHVALTCYSCPQTSRFTTICILLTGHEHTPALTSRLTSLLATNKVFLFFLVLFMCWNRHIQHRPQADVSDSVSVHLDLLGFVNYVFGVSVIVKSGWVEGLAICGNCVGIVKFLVWIFQRYLTGKYVMTLKSFTLQSIHYAQNKKRGPPNLSLKHKRVWLMCNVTVIVAVTNLANVNWCDCCD